MATCKSCELIARRDLGTSPLWDNIYRTEHWDVAHCNETTLPGWLVLIVRRHIAAIDELTGAEAKELGRLIRQTSIALKEISGCVKTYVLQFAENPNHPHVHFHVIPRPADLPDDRIGPKIFGYLGASESERVPEATMNSIGAEVRDILQSKFTALSSIA